MRIETDREDDGRWIAEVTDIPGAMAYGDTREEAVSKAKAIALRALADGLERGDAHPDVSALFVLQA